MGLPAKRSVFDGPRYFLTGFCRFESQGGLGHSDARRRMRMPTVPTFWCPESAIFGLGPGGGYDWDSVLREGYSRTTEQLGMALFLMGLGCGMGRGGQPGPPALRHCSTAARCLVQPPVLPPDVRIRLVDGKVASRQSMPTPCRYPEGPGPTGDYP